MGRKKKKVRGKSRYYILWLLLLITVFYAGHKGTVYLKKIDLFEISSIQIRGNQLLNIDYLHSISEPFKGENIFDINIKDIEARYYAISRIKKIKCRKIYPGKLQINITERKGVFFIKDTNGGFHPIDEDKIVLDKADWYLEEDLPLINLSFDKNQIVLGQKIEDARIDLIFNIYSILRKEKASVLSDISEFYFKDSYLHFVDIKSSSRVILSKDNLVDQINRFIFLRDNQGFERNSTIDLRFDSQIIII